MADTVVALAGEQDHNPVTLRIETKFISRVRAVLPNLEPGLQAHTRIDHLQGISFAMGQPQQVVSEIDRVRTAGGISTLATLDMPDGSPLWFDGSKAQGPMPYSTTIAPPGTQSAFILSNRLQHVRNSPNQVHDVIAAKGGAALPLPPRPSDINASVVTGIQDWLAPDGVWDVAAPDGASE